MLWVHMSYLMKITSLPFRRWVPALRQLRGVDVLCLGLLFSLMSPLSAADAALAQSGSNPDLMFAKSADNGAADELFLFDLGNGQGIKIDQLRRGADSGRVVSLKANLFSDFGRPTSQAAGVGEVFLGPLHGSDGSVRAALLVEASTGYTMFYDQLGRGEVLGRATTMIKRGYESVAATDGKFGLLMVRNGSGRTDGGFLYHGGSGRAAYLGKLNDLEIDPPIAMVSGLPQTVGLVSSAPIVSSEETLGWMIVDNADGQVHLFDVTGSISRINVRTPSIRLAELMTGEQINPSPQRFVLVPLTDDEVSTQGVLVIDVGTGGTAMIDGLRGPRPRVSIRPQNVYTAIRGGIKPDAPRYFSAAPANRSSGETEGIWLRDSLTGDMVFIESPASATALRARPMTLVER